MKRNLFFWFVAAMGIFPFRHLSAQELQCNVNVVSPQVQSTDKHVYDNMRTAIQEFVNSTVWTEDKFLPMEKIECNFFITVSEAIGADKFKASLQVQSVRPVFDASYNSTIFNCFDEEFTFTYVEFSKIELMEGTFISNLSSVLAYYIYVIIGLDYDSYSKFGGTNYFRKAQAIANQAQGTEYKGWEAFSTKKSNRYWLVSQLLDPNFNAIREVIYIYHRLGLDLMTTQMETARNNITEALLKLKKVYRDEPNSYLLQLFLTAKRDEIIKIYSEATTQEKEQIIELVKEIDGGNISKYTEKLGVK